jgi:hypothetical protein
MGNPTVWGVTVASVLVVVGIGAWYVAPTTNGPRLPELQVLDDRTIVDFAYNSDGTVAYSYLAAKVPDKLAENEVTELRNETSYTKFIEVITPGDDPTLKLETVIYSQPAYAQDADGSWKYLEYATTTEQAFRDRNMTLGKYLTEFFVRSAYADTVSPFSGAGDGGVVAFLSDNNPGCTVAPLWSGTRGSGSGGSETDTLTTFEVYSNIVYSDEPGGDPDQCAVYIGRGFLPFDTSALPAASIVSAVTLNVYITLTNDDDNDASAYITVSTSSQATHTSLALGDFDLAGPVTMNSSAEVVSVGTRKDITSIVTSSYLSFDLDSDGIAAVKKNGDTSTCSATTGITCFALREGHDAAASQPADNTVTGINLSASEFTGTSQDPYLTVSYATTEKHLVKIATGRLKMTGGRFKLQSN